MCTITFQIDASDSDGSVVAGQGRYRVVGSTTWSLFTIPDINNPITPDITTNGTYELEVRVQDDDGAWSNWEAANETFTVTDCPSNNPPVISSVTLLANSCCNSINV